MTRERRLRRRCGGGEGGRSERGGYVGGLHGEERVEKIDRDSSWDSGGMKTCA